MNRPRYLNLISLKFILSLLTCSILISCTGMPDKVKPVQNFNLNQYLGTWHEVARLDHRFEANLNQVTAEYTLLENGELRVINRGFNVCNNEWEQAKGTAKFVDNHQLGYLKVSFFGPFYGSYVIFELDENYQYAFVSGPTTEYLWLLSRQNKVPDSVKKSFIRQIEEKGFNRKNLIWASDQIKCD